MKEKINYTECMKRKCEQCKRYNKCFKEKEGGAKCQEERKPTMKQYIK